MTKELFHGRNHPIYQHIEMVDNFIQRIMPEDLKEFLDHHCSISRSGHKSMGQGYDFELEVENKAVKNWIKQGVPSKEMWLLIT